MNFQNFILINDQLLDIHQQQAADKWIIKHLGIPRGKKGLSPTKCSQIMLYQTALLVVWSCLLQSKAEVL
jgi:hypothetical protein